MIVAEPRQGPADRHLEPEKENHLGEEDPHVDQHHHEVGAGGSQKVEQFEEPGGGHERNMPRSEKENGHDRGDRHHLDEFGHEEHAELESAVFGEVTRNEFGFRFRVVEGDALVLGDGGGQEHEKSQRLQENAPVKKTFLRRPDLGQLHGAVHHQHADDGEPHGDLVGNHLGCGAHGSQEGPVVVGAPTGDDVTVGGDRGDRENEQQSHIQIGDDQFHFLAEQQVFAAERHHREGEDGGDQRHDRAQGMQHLVGPLGNEIFLGEHLDAVGDGVEQPEHGKAQDIGPVGADPVLHDGALLPFHPGQHGSKKSHGDEKYETDFKQCD